MIELGTHPASARCYQMCRCSNCGTEAMCTPQFDFYGEHNEPLKCERCFREDLVNQDINPDIITINESIKQH